MAPPDTTTNAADSNEATAAKTPPVEQTVDASTKAPPPPADKPGPPKLPDTAKPAERRHTQDRDPANRESWKAERAKALGHAPPEPDKA